MPLQRVKKSYLFSTKWTDLFLNSKYLLKTHISNYDTPSRKSIRSFRLVDRLNDCRRNWVMWSLHQLNKDGHSPSQVSPKSTADQRNPEHGMKKRSPNDYGATFSSTPKRVNFNENNVIQKQFVDSFISFSNRCTNYMHRLLVKICLP